MAEEFQGGVCGGNWWITSPRNLFGSSPCSLASNDIRSFGWPNQDPIIDMKTTRSSTDESAGSASDGSSSMHTTPNGTSMSMDSTLHMMGTPDACWNQDFLNDSSGRSEENYSNILQEARDFTQIHSNFSDDSSNINSYKQVNQSFNPLNSISGSSESCAVISCQGLSAGFPLNSSSYTYTSSLLQTLFDADSQSQQSLLDNQAMNYTQVDTNEILSGLANKTAPMVNPSCASKQPPNSHLPFNNNAPLWNATAAALSFLPPTQPQFIPSSINNKKSTNLPGFSAKHRNEEARDLSSVAKKAGNEPAFKRPRIETPSPLPTFKVRKEKLGDRVTALQQLVSPFGKTDTASVLHEAIDYIKFLHEQVSALSTPYLKNGSPPLQRQQGGDKAKNEEGLIQDLKSRGLCLVPISSTFPVAAETNTDFWIPTFGGTFK